MKLGYAPTRRNKVPVPPDVRARIIAVRAREISLNRACSALGTSAEMFTLLTESGAKVQSSTLERIVEKLTVYEAKHA